MVRYTIVRYTKQVVAYADGKEMAKAIAKGIADKDYDNTVDYVWYELEPDHVY